MNPSWDGITVALSGVDSPFVVFIQILQPGGFAAESTVGFWQNGHGRLCVTCQPFTQFCLICHGSQRMSHLAVHGKLVKKSLVDQLFTVRHRLCLHQLDDQQGFLFFKTQNFILPMPEVTTNLGKKLIWQEYNCWALFPSFYFM